CGETLPCCSGNHRGFAPTCFALRRPSEALVEAKLRGTHRVAIWRNSQMLPTPAEPHVVRLMLEVEPHAVAFDEHARRRGVLSSQTPPLSQGFLFRRSNDNCSEARQGERYRQQACH